VIQNAQYRTATRAMAASLDHESVDHGLVLDVFAGFDRIFGPAAWNVDGFLRWSANR
jgi:hypothetical protein